MKTHITLAVLVWASMAMVSGLPEEDWRPKLGGNYKEAKLSRATCGGKKELEPGEEVTISSPGYPEKYPNNNKCKWDIVSKDPKDTLEVNCPSFYLRKSKWCRGDRLVLSDGKKAAQRLCGQGQKKFTANSNQLTLTFRTNKKGKDKGFECTVKSLAAYGSLGTTDDMFSSTDAPTTKPPATKPPTGGNCNCGVANPSRIVGGVEVSPTHKYPWQVGLKIRRQSAYWCGGSIINDRYVLTAAHCFFNKEGERESDRGLVVGVGDHDMSSGSDDVSGVTKLVAVKKVIIHASYDPKQYDYDIAVLLLREPLNLSSHEEVGAVCLPQDDTKTYVGEMGIASGWGTLQSGGDQPSKLMEVKLPILDQSCWGKSITPRMMCAGYKEGGKDTCQGDSGGPFYVAENSKYVQVGIVSFGDGCASPNSAGVYARVSKFLSWIKTNTAGATYCQ
ncbi:trypsin-1-like [Homarus americanus]|uniref:Ovochymase-1-like n=1 Tax=Homarus americanus TaxID=6706 RepID=A0A8J5JQ41_HOMAM|nr:trypsin-1-like [Homarus americanus]KAG7160263.1 Ovochymase-1-like [Homarus americanus]